MYPMVIASTAPAITSFLPPVRDRLDWNMRVEKLRSMGLHPGLASVVLGRRR
jgi:hypothetical protein